MAKDALKRHAFNKTMGHEGFYANHPDDRGGETYRGIARKFHPNWSGWKIIDHIKRENPYGFKKVIQDNFHKLDDKVYDFYIEHFWNKCNCDAVADVNERIAIELFDTAVNCGTKTAQRFLQEAINLCNQDASGKSNIAEDGVIGPKTILALNGENKKSIHITQNLLQGEYYMNICRKRASQKVFFNGWLNRIMLVK